ncbi:hypothetical protein Hanom_Chr17g01524511 [Helianthus anomalus]
MFMNINMRFIDKLKSKSLKESCLTLGVLNGSCSWVQPDPNPKILHKPEPENRIIHKTRTRPVQPEFF